MILNTYSTNEVAQISGFSVRQLEYWAEQGLIVPSVQQAHGSGTRRRYSLDDLVQLRFVRQLKVSGLSIQKIRKAVLQLREILQDPNPLKSTVVIGTKGVILAICKTKEGERVIFDALSPGGQQMMSIILEVLQEEVRQASESLTTEGLKVDV